MRAEMRSNFNDPCGQIASFVAGAEEKTQHPWFVTKDAQIKVFVFWVSLAGRRQDECPQDEEVIQGICTLNAEHLQPNWP